MIIRPNSRELRKIKEHYSIVPHHTTKDKNLSDKSYRLLNYMCTFPPGWKFNQTQLCKHFGIHRVNLSIRFKELKELGYLEMSRVRIGEDVYQWYYAVYSIPKMKAMEAILGKDVDEIGAENIVSFQKYRKGKAG